MPQSEDRPRRWGASITFGEPAAMEPSASVAVLMTDKNSRGMWNQRADMPERAQGADVIPKPLYPNKTGKMPAL